MALAALEKETQLSFPGGIDSASPVRVDPYRRYLAGRRALIREHYSGPAFSTLAWPFPRMALRRAIINSLKSCVPGNRRVLDVGCGDGEILEALAPSRGVGIDFCPAQIQRAKKRSSQGMEFICLEAERASSLQEKFDDILLVNVAGELMDIGGALKQLRGLCHDDTRLAICSHSTLWWPIFVLTQKLRLSNRSRPGNWLSRSDIEAFGKLADFEIIRFFRFFPFVPPGKSLRRSLWGWLARWPFWRRFGIYEMTILRPLPLRLRQNHWTTSIVVPCKDEEGKIDEIVRRIPEFGAGIEIIFVDDQSRDGTSSKVRESIRRHPGRAIRLVPGPGQGKGAAVRAGFEEARGEVYMILDADLSVCPEVLPEFYECLACGRADFVNGSRLVYPMEGDAMRAANIVGNKFFAALFSFLLHQPLKDTLCGTKALRASDYPKIMQTRLLWGGRDQWGDYDWIFGAAKNNLRILDLPVHYFKRTSGQTKMTRRLRHAWVMLTMCWIAFQRLDA